MKGICQIYKRATLITNDGQTKILDYSNGTRSHECEVQMLDGQPLYIWNVAGQTIPIPLNVGRNKTLSIIEKGDIQVDDGIIKWEFIFGTYKKKSYLTYIVLVAILVFLLLKYQNKI